MGLAGEDFSRVDTAEQAEVCVCAGWYCNGAAKAAESLRMMLFLSAVVFAVLP